MYNKGTERQRHIEEWIKEVVVKPASAEIRRKKQSPNRDLVIIA